jgi:hypothetical protein
MSQSAAATEFQNRLSYRHRPIRPACEQEAATIELKSTVAHQQKRWRSSPHKLQEQATQIQMQPHFFFRILALAG